VTADEVAPEVWERIDEAGIRVMRIPTPFQVGRVNVYLLEDDPLTLVDAGPNSGKALDELEQQLGAPDTRSRTWSW
jgi:glyoxylase-like metal-dependent hydrolase (beta-lactamase superfamily II)